MSAIILDFDGTIADSFDFVVGLLADRAGKQLQPDDFPALRGMSMAAVGRQFGLSWYRLFNLFLVGRRRMADHIEKVKPFEGMPELIEKLHAEGHELFILTSNTVRSVHTFLHHYGLHKYFFEVYGNISLFGKAPALRRLLRENNLQPKDAIYIGDELRDVEAAQSLKVKIVAVSWGFARLSDLEKLKPTRMVHSPAELLTALEEI